MKRLIVSLLIVSGVAAGAVGASRAFFSDTETSHDNILAAGAIDLQIDNTSYYNNQPSQATSWQVDDLTNQLFFNFLDVKPSDRGEDTISLHVKDNDAWACMDIKLTKNADNTCNEPELLDDPTCDPSPAATQSGELAQNVNFVFWADDGDNVLETGENVFKEGNSLALLDGSKWKIADSTGNIWGNSDPLKGLDTYYIGKAWCFGTLTKAPLTQDGVNNLVTPANTNGGILCDGSSLNNAAQTDIMMADVNFEVVQHRNNPNFVCGQETPGPTPTPIACVPAFASEVASTNQGTRKNGTAVLVARSNPITALVPQTTGLAFDPAPVDGTFYSLGFKTLTPGVGGSLTVKFASPVFNGPGPDLKIYEVTGGPPYPDEKVQVEVSPDNITYTNLGVFTKDASMDMVIPTAQYVRLTDNSVNALFEATADGYDVDGVQALCANSVPTPTPTACVKKPDVMLVLDRSGSISSSEMTTLKNASKAFVDALNPSLNTAHVGMVSFSTNALLNKHLTDNGPDVKSGIDSLFADGFTNLKDAIDTADLELDNPGDGHDRADATSPDYMVIVTDGEPNRPLPSNTAGSVAAAAATAARADGITVYVVGVGVTPANETYLKTQIADDAAHYFSAADFGSLQTILQGIANCPR